MSRLADLAKHLIVPGAAISTGWPKVRDTCNNLGWAFDDWQDDLGRLILAKDKAKLYASSLCVMSLPRQVGKTYLVGCIAFALCLTEPGTTVIWTAHRGRTATETFRAMKAKARSAELAAFIDQRVKGGGIRSSNGEQEIEFLNGSRILFGAREGGFGVGFADVGMLVLDEVQRATTRTMDDLLPTTNAAANPLVLCMGTPPRPTDDGEVFSMLRREAVAGESDDVLYVELGASERFDLSDEVEFWRQLRQVNPAFPHRVGERAILRNKKGLSDDSVFREVFGLWDDLAKSYAFGAGKWESCAIDGDDPKPHPAALALSVSMDRKFSSIGGAAHVEIEEKPRLMGAAVDRREGTGWLVPEAKRLHETYGCRIAVTRSAADLIPALEAVGLRVGHELEVVRAGDSQDACAVIYDRVQQGVFAHANHDDLDESVYGAHRRDVAGRWVWDRKNSETDVSMLEAVTAATWLASIAAPTYDVLDSIL